MPERPWVVHRGPQSSHFASRYNAQGAALGMAVGQPIGTHVSVTNRGRVVLTFRKEGWGRIVVKILDLECLDEGAS